MANEFYGAIALTGGGEGALDAIDGALLADLDGAVVITASGTYVYSLDANSAAAEASPGIIAPDDNPGDKRWILVVGNFAGVAAVASPNNPTWGADVNCDKPARIVCGAATPQTMLQVYYNRTVAADNLYGIEFANITGQVNAAIVVRQTGSNNAAHLSIFTDPGDGGTGMTGALERVRVQHDGGVTVYALKSGANQGAAGAAADELWRDTADNSIKLGV